MWTTDAEMAPPVAVTGFADHDIDKRVFVQPFGRLKCLFINVLIDKQVFTD